MNKDPEKKWKGFQHPSLLCDKPAKAIKNFTKAATLRIFNQTNGVVFLYTHINEGFNTIKCFASFIH